MPDPSVLGIEPYTYPDIGPDGGVQCYVIEGTPKPDFLPGYYASKRLVWITVKEKLFLREEPSAAAIESLHHGRADCVLLALPYATGEVETEVLFKDELLVAFPKDDPRDPPATITADLIDENRLLLLEDGHCLKEHALAACNRPELRASATMIGTSAAFACSMASSVWGITPSSAAITRTTRSIPPTPASMVFTNRSCPGTSTSPTRRPLGRSRCAKPRSMVIPRRFSSSRRSGSMPVRAWTRADLPWSTWPAVPITYMITDCP